MNRLLIEAVIATLQTEDADSHGERLSKFHYNSWEGIYKWLDASGLALYFFARVQSMHLQEKIPSRVLMRLSENANDNRVRTNNLFEEFIRINREFKREGLSYANLKGFTLAPDAFSDAALRCQLDLDFFVASDDICRCQQILNKQGYLLVGNGNDVKELKTKEDKIPVLGDLYKTMRQRCVEIHFDNSGGPDEVGLLSKLALRQWRDLELPVLSDCDRFVAQAHHLFKHLKSEWTRASWIFEYSNYVNFNDQNANLWIEVKHEMVGSKETTLAVGAATHVVQQNFNIPRLPSELFWAVDQLPPRVSLWIERYGRRIMRATFPGTKLHFLLFEALQHEGGLASYDMDKQLFPLRLPARISIDNKEAGLLLRLNEVRDETAYFFFRLQFHLTQSWHYLIETIRWKRVVASLYK